MSGDSVFLAKCKRTLDHYVIRFVEDENVWGMPAEGFPDFLNELMAAKGHKQMLAAISGAPLLVGDKGGPRQPRRIMAVEEFSDCLEAEFERCDPKRLAREMFLFYPTPLKANNSKSSVAASHDIFRYAAAEIPDSGFVAIVEPLQDWMCFRNLLAIGGALLAGIEDPRCVNPVDAAGFKISETNAIGEPLYVCEFKYYSAVYNSQFLNHPIVSAQRDDIDTDYLYTLYRNTGVEKEWSESVHTCSLGGDEGVFFLSHSYATNQGLLKSAAAPGGRNLYLCAIADGSQEDVARRVVRALWDSTQTLTDTEGKTLGMTEYDDALFDPKRRAIDYDFHSLVAQSWNALCSHTSHRLVACRQCGCGVLARNRGYAREFCGVNCRTKNWRESGR